MGCSISLKPMTIQRAYKLSEYAGDSFGKKQTERVAKHPQEGAAKMGQSTTNSLGSEETPKKQYKEDQTSFSALALDYYQSSGIDKQIVRRNLEYVSIGKGRTELNVIPEIENSCTSSF